MGLFRSLAVLLFLVCFFRLRDIGVQSINASTNVARALDSLLQDYAYRAFVRPKTGVPYNSSVPSNLTGIKIAAMRLRSGSFRKRGVRSYREFSIPTGVIVKPYVTRIVLVYQDLGNWSESYYALPGYSYVAPVLGLLSYDAKNLSAKNLPELEIRASQDPISIVFSDVKSIPEGSAAKCVRFGLQGLVNLSDVVSGNTCSTMEQGHFSIVVRSAALAPPLAISPRPPTAGAPAEPAEQEKKSNTKMWIIVGSVVSGIVLLAMSSFLVLWVRKYKHQKQMREMEMAAEAGEPLNTALVRDTRAPSARLTRTQPVLETEFMP